MGQVFESPAVNAREGESVSRMVADSALLNPDKPALICDGETVTWKEFNGRINQVANQLLGMGLNKGEKVAILAYNSNEYAEIFMGIARAGLCIVPLPTMASSDSLKRMIEDSQSRVIFLSKQLFNLAEPFLGNLPGLDTHGRIAIDFEKHGWQPYESWRSGASESSPDVKIELGDELLLIYSSGTTGVPKGIVHTNGLRTAIVKSLGNFGVDHNSTTIISTPIYSNTTLATFITGLAVGGTAVIMRKFDVEEFLELTQRHRATFVMLVPVQYQRLMAHPKFDTYDLSSMQLKLSTSAPLREQLKRDIVARFPGTMFEIYGLTEGGGGTVLACHAFPDKLASVGVALPEVDLRIIDELGKEVTQGSIGEIVSRGPGMMKGYHGREDLTKEALWYNNVGEAFLRSGDMGYLDEDGFLYLGDRKKDMIVSGGFNIFANDLENELLRHEAVDDATVIGVPSEEWGETPLALVVLKSGAHANEESILSFVNHRLGKAQRISALEFRDSLPRSPIGKVLKLQLRKPYWKENK